MRCYGSGVRFRAPRHFATRRRGGSPLTRLCPVAHAVRIRAGCQVRRLSSERVLPRQWQAPPPHRLPGARASPSVRVAVQISRRRVIARRWWVGGDGNSAPACRQLAAPAGTVPACQLPHSGAGWWQAGGCLDGNPQPSPHSRRHTRCRVMCCGGALAGLGSREGERPDWDLNPGLRGDSPGCYVRLHHLGSTAWTVW